MTTQTRDWRAEYAKAVAVEEDDAAATGSGSQQTQVCSVLAFLDLLVAEEGGECVLSQLNKRKSGGQTTKTIAVQGKEQVMSARTRLAAVAKELVIAVPELNASVSGKQASRTTKVRVLQLQILCRLLRYGGLKKQERKEAKKEIRGLLDRVALLLDAANPPSLADEDADERSPFQKFLLQQLVPRLHILMPELMRYLLKVYELVEDDEIGANQSVKDAPTTLLPPVAPVVKRSQSLTAMAGPTLTEKDSILAALLQERPTKRPCSEAKGLFKEIQLPQQLQQRKVLPRPHKSRRTSKSVTSGDKRRIDGKSKDSNSKDRTTQDALLRAAATTKPVRRPVALNQSGPQGAWTATSSNKTALLQRTGRPSSAPPLLHRPQTAGTAIARQTQVSSAPGSSVVGKTGLRRSVTTSSVVMRTPDRPRRSAVRSTRRVLVEASPPLRNPNAAGATSAPRRLQPKSSRPGGTYPPPLFR